MTQEPIQNIVSNVIEETPYGARKSAEIDIQFAIDPTYGLTRERYGWYSNDNLFDNTLLTEQEGSILVETTATGTDIGRLRSAYPGQYVSQTLAEPGIGVRIPSEHIERDSDGFTSLTHGEISVEAVEWDETTDSGINALGLSFESDGVYVQIRKNGNDIAFIHQSDWNIDPLNGEGPSGDILKPENGLIYNFPFSWYGYGELYIAVQNNKTGQIQLVHKEVVKEEPSLGTPNMPIQVTVQNGGTADPLGAEVGGMQWSTYGTGNLNKGERGRTTEETRQTGDTYISSNVTLSNDAIDPFAEPGEPLISVRRNLDELDSRVSLSVEVEDFFINSGGDLYIFIFDEFDEDNALVGETFSNPESRNLTDESRIETDTQATDYTPGSNAVLRGILFIKGGKNEAEVIAGDSNSRLPIDSASIVTAALPPGDNATYAQPALLTVREAF